MTTICVNPNGRCDLTIQIGHKLKINNLPLYMADEFVHRTVCGQIKKLVCIRRAEIDLGINPRRGSNRAFNELVYRFNKMHKWPMETLAIQILHMQPQFLDILPNPAANSYAELSQISFDLILWASQYLNPQDYATV